MPRKSREDEDIINLRDDEESDEAEFKINRFEDEEVEVSKQVQSTPVTELENAAMKPYDKVKVKFDKFVNLIATHAYEDIFEKHIDEDVIISTDLLTDLANAHEEKQDRKMPLVFVIGIILGVGVAWILLRT